MAGVRPGGRGGGETWDGALDAQRAFGDLDGYRPVLLGVAEAFDDGTAYRAEPSARVDLPVLSDDPTLQYDLQLPGASHRTRRSGIPGRTFSAMSRRTLSFGRAPDVLHTVKSQ